MNQLKLPTLIVIYCVYLIFATLTLERGVFSISFVDVGQGDAIYIKTKNNRSILIDSGENRDVINFIQSKHIFPTCSIDWLILTHMDKDHIGVAPDILTRCKVKTIWINDVSCETAVCKDVYQKSIGIQVKNAFIGDELYIDDVYIKILSPDRDKYYNGYYNDNAGSIVLLLQYKEFEAILTGDAEESTFSEIDTAALNMSINGILDVYKVAHHGALTGLNTGFILDVKPKYCVISVGNNNKYNHPHPNVLSFMEESGCIIKRTDKLGTIEFKVR